MALTDDNPREEAVGGYSRYPVDAQEIFEGAHLQSDGSGHAQNCAENTSNAFLGKADEYVDNSGGSAGDKAVRMRTGVWREKVTISGGISAGDEGSAVYAQDDGTLTTTETTDSAANAQVGKIHLVLDASANEAIVQYEALI